MIKLVATIDVHVSSHWTKAMRWIKIAVAQRVVSTSPQPLILVLKQDLTQVVVVSTLAMNEIAKHASTHHIQHGRFGRIVTAVLHDQAMPSRRFRRVDNFPAVFERVSRRHFGAAMLARTQSSEHLRDVPFPRRRDVDEVEIVASNESFKI